MAEWNRGDAEMAIAVKRAELNRALSYKSKYDAEDHNVCLALLRFTDASTDVIAAYSNDSAIPESIRLGLNLIPDLYASVSSEQRFGCSGMAQFHTEPKLLNYICAAPAIRRAAYSGDLPRGAFYKSFLEKQRGQASKQAELMKRGDDLASLTLVTEIDCCCTCTEYSISRFRAKFTSTPLQLIELGKKVSKKVPVQSKQVRVTTQT